MKEVFRRIKAGRRIDPKVEDLMHPFTWRKPAPGTYRKRFKRKPFTRVYNPTKKMPSVAQVARQMVKTYPERVFNLVLWSGVNADEAKAWAHTRTEAKPETWYTLEDMLEIPGKPGTNIYKTQLLDGEYKDNKENWSIASHALVKAARRGMLFIKPKNFSRPGGKSVFNEVESKVAGMYGIEIEFHNGPCKKRPEGVMKENTKEADECEAKLGSAPLVGPVKPGSSPLQQFPQTAKPEEPKKPTNSKKRP